MGSVEFYGCTNTGKLGVDTEFRFFFIDFYVFRELWKSFYNFPNNSCFVSNLLLFSKFGIFFQTYPFPNILYFFLIFPFYRIFLKVFFICNFHVFYFLKCPFSYFQGFHKIMKICPNFSFFLIFAFSKSFILYKTFSTFLKFF